MQLSQQQWVSKLYLQQRNIKVSVVVTWQRTRFERVCTLNLSTHFHSCFMNFMKMGERFGIRFVYTRLPLPLSLVSYKGVLWNKIFRKGISISWLKWLSLGTCPVRTWYRTRTVLRISRILSNSRKIPGHNHIVVVRLHPPMFFPIRCLLIVLKHSVNMPVIAPIAKTRMLVQIKSSS